MKTRFTKSNELVQRQMARGKATPFERQQAPVRTASGSDQVSTGKYAAG
ncbi:MAG: hypothetical protein H0U18_09110 [Pyrinomonadaceae bacterium]|nr:hypothetical protein [Pyrinomonadaceae bacterium]